VELVLAVLVLGYLLSRLKAVSPPVAKSVFLPRVEGPLEALEIEWESERQALFAEVQEVELVPRGHPRLSAA